MKSLKNNSKKLVYKWCIVPYCKNTTKTAPNKDYFPVPQYDIVRRKWCEVMKRDAVPPVTDLYCCEDHFDLKKDTEILALQEQQLCLREGVLPHIFKCQKDYEQTELQLTAVEATAIDNITETKQCESNGFYSPVIIENNDKLHLKDAIQVNNKNRKRPRLEMTHGTSSCKPVKAVSTENIVTEQYLSISIKEEIKNCVVEPSTSSHVFTENNDKKHFEKAIQLNNNDHKRSGLEMTHETFFKPLEAIATKNATEPKKHASITIKDEINDGVETSTSSHTITENNVKLHFVKAIQGNSSDCKRLEMNQEATLFNPVEAAATNNINEHTQHHASISFEKEINDCGVKCSTSSYDFTESIKKNGFGQLPILPIYTSNSMGNFDISKDYVLLMPTATMPLKEYSTYKVPNVVVKEIDGQLNNLVQIMDTDPLQNAVLWSDLPQKPVPRSDSPQKPVTRPDSLQKAQLRSDSLQKAKPQSDSLQQDILKKTKPMLDSLQKSMPRRDSFQNAVPRPDSLKKSVPRPDSLQNAVPQPDSLQTTMPRSNSLQTMPQPDSLQTTMPRSDSLQNAVPRSDSFQKSVLQRDLLQRPVPRPDSLKKAEPHAWTTSENILRGELLKDVTVVSDNNNNKKRKEVSKHRITSENLLHKKVLNSSGNKLNRINTITKIKLAPRRYIGIPSSCYFILDLIELNHKIPEKHILFCLKKIRLNTTFTKLSKEFGIPEGHARKVFLENVPIIASALNYYVLLILKQNMNESNEFKLPIDNNKNGCSKRSSIIDCLEVQIENPVMKNDRNITLSKSSTTSVIKYLISCTCDGLVDYVSQGYVGSISDKALLNNCNYSDALECGTCFLGDTGLKDIERHKKFKHNMERLKSNINRVMHGVRDYAILDSHSAVDTSLLTVLDEIVVIVCALINLKYSYLINKHSVVSDSPYTNVQEILS